MSGQPHSFGPFLLHPGRELLRDGRAVPVGQRALAMLEVLLGANGAAVTKNDLLERVWPGLVVEEGNITVQIAALRKELGTQPDGSEWIVTIPRVGYRLVRPAVEGSASAEPSQGGTPRLAILPFVNLSGDASRDYFADGLVEDLITALSRFKSMSVVSRSSSFVYKGRPTDVRHVAAELGVRYLLEGSLRLAGERVRITVQLVDAQNGTHLWAANFDGELGQIFEFQDKVTESVAGLVEPHIRRAEIVRTRRRWPDSPAAYDHFLRALPHFYSRDPAGYAEALAHLEQAIALEPDYALARAYASWALARGGLVSLVTLGDEDRERCIDLAQTAIGFGDDDPLVQAICGHSLVAIGLRRSEGLAAVRRALDLNPNSVPVLMLAGICNMLAGDLSECEAAHRRAYQLSPGSPEAHECLAGIGFAHFFRADYAGAVEWFERSRATTAEWPPAFWGLAAAYAHLGKDAEARAVAQRLVEISPHTSLARLSTVAPRFDGRFAMLETGLVRAGLN